MVFICWFGGVQQAPGIISFNPIHNHLFCEIVIDCTVNNHWLRKSYYKIISFAKWEKNCVTAKDIF